MIAFVIEFQKSKFAINSVNLTSIVQNVKLNSAYFVSYMGMGKQPF